MKINFLIMRGVWEVSLTWGDEVDPCVRRAENVIQLLGHGVESSGVSYIL